MLTVCCPFHAQVAAVLLDMETEETDGNTAAGVSTAQPRELVEQFPRMEVQIRTKGELYAVC